MRTRTGPASRPGYTLIELMVVIAIIAILVGLLLVAVQKVRDTGNRSTTVSEITQLDISLTAFNERYKFYPPSHIVDEVVPQTTPATMHVRRFVWPTRIDSKEYVFLTKMFPRWKPPLMPDNVTIDVATIASPTAPGLNHPEYLQLVNKGPLDANQVMVLMLGGPGTLLGPSAGFQPGWDKIGPYAPSGNSKDGPFYDDFKEGRLTDRSASPPAVDGKYRDPYGTPYAYFSINPSSSNDIFHGRYAYPWPAGMATATFAGFTSPQEYAALTYDPATDTGTNKTAHPLAASVVQKPQTQGGGVTVKWMNPGRIQIVSAGRNLQFGFGTYNPTGYPPTGSPWPVLTAAQMPPAWVAASGNYLQGQIGEDDLANFNSGQQLSNPAN